jgi:hypothetical protein
VKAIYIEGQHEEILQTENDLCLFRAPRKTADWQKFPSGKDLYMHKAGTGRETYYLLHWSVRPNKKEQIAQVSQGMAEKFLEDRGIFFNSVSKEDEKAVATMKQYGWGILEEF